MRRSKEQQDTTRANGLGREGRRGDINCAHKGTALVTSRTHNSQDKNYVVTGRKEGSWNLVDGLRSRSIEGATRANWKGREGDINCTDKEERGRDGK